MDLLVTFLPGREPKLFGLLAFQEEVPEALKKLMEEIKAFAVGTAR